MAGIDFNNLGGMLVQADAFVTQSGGPLGALTQGYKLIDENLSPDVPGIDLKSGFTMVSSQFGENIPEEYKTYDAAKASLAAKMQEYGVDAGILTDDVIDPKEFARIVATNGFAELEKRGLAPNDITEANHPEAFAAARKFAEEHGLDVKANPEYLVGLAGFEVAVQGAISDYKATGTIPGTAPAVVDPKAVPAPGGG